MRKPKQYYPINMNVRIDSNLDQAIWAAADARDVDRSRFVREVLEKAVAAELQKIRAEKESI